MDVTRARAENHGEGGVVGVGCDSGEGGGGVGCDSGEG